MVGWQPAIECWSFVGTRSPFCLYILYNKTPGCKILKKKKEKSPFVLVCRCKFAVWMGFSFIITTVIAPKYRQ